MTDPAPRTPIRITRGSATTEAAVPLDLGARVRGLRKERDWTLEQAARQAGLARSTLSKIENGQMSPTFDALKKLATGLGITVPQLFTPPAAAAGAGRLSVTRRDAGTVRITPTYAHDLLAEDLGARRMRPYRARIHARRMEDFDGWVRHDGEEFLYVLSGTVRLFTEEFAAVDLEPGDSAYYDATMGHNVVSVGPEDATILWVTSLV